MDAIVFENVVSTWQGKIGKPGTESYPNAGDTDAGKQSAARARKVVAYLNKRLDKVTVTESDDGTQRTYEVLRDGSTTHAYRVIVAKAEPKAEA